VPRSPLLTAGLALAAVIAVGTTGYMLIIGMGFTDAMYMTITTLSTVGFREVAPLGRAGQWFTMALIVGGIGIVFYSATALARDLIEGELRRGFGRRRVEKRIQQMEDHVIVCGFGRMGRAVCKELAAKPAPFVVIDRDPEMLRHADAEGYAWLSGDASEDLVLEAAGITRAQGLVAALPSDADNVYVVLTARELNPRLVIVARGEDDRGQRKLLHAGATRVVSPYAIGGHRMAHALLRPAVLDVLDLATHSRSLELQIEELAVEPGAFCAGATLGHSGLREGHGVIIIAVKRGEEMRFNPDAETRVEAGDRLVLMGSRDTLSELERRLRTTGA
jgi:voltage-gated potassium channel